MAFSAIFGITLSAAYRCVLLRLQYGCSMDGEAARRRNARPGRAPSDGAKLYARRLYVVAATRARAESASLGRFPCSWLRAIAACCALGDVNSGVNSYDIRQGESLCALPTCCNGVPAPPTVISPLLPHRDSVIRDVTQELRRTLLPRTRVNMERGKAGA